MKRVVLLLLSIVFSANHWADELIILTENNRPYSYREAGEIKGFSTELVKAMVDVTGVDVKYFVLYPWARAYKMAQEEKNVLLYSVTRRPDREALFKWVGPIASNRKYLFRLAARNDIQVSNLEDAKNYVVGVVRDSSLAEQLLDMGFVNGSNLDLVADKTLNTRRMYAKRVDLIANTELGMRNQMRLLGFDYSDLTIAFELPESADYYLAFNLDTPDEIVKQFQQALDALKLDGTYQRLENNLLNE